MVTLNTTPNRGYQEPAVGNTLEVDVGRLIAALRAIDVDVAGALAQIVSKAALASPAFTGTPTAPTAAPGTDSGQLATTAFVKAALVALVDSAPGALDTLNELAAAIGDDPNFAATMAALIGTKADAAATTAALAGKADATATANALGKRVRVDAAQSLTPAEKGRAIANLDGGVLAGFRDKLINGDGQVNQRTYTTVADDVYWCDRHYVLTQTAVITPTVITDVADGLPFMMRLTQTQATAQRMGNAQIVEAAVAKRLRGKKVTLGGKLRSSLAQVIRYAVLEWTGTADTVTSDVVQLWTSATYAPGGFFIGAGVAVAAIGSITLTANTITDFSLPADVSSACNNLIVFYWTEGTAVQNSTLDMAWGLVEGDASAEKWPYGARHPEQELRLCQRYYVADATTRYMFTRGSNTPNAANGNQVDFPVTMRPVPTFAIGAASFMTSVSVPTITATGAMVTATSTSTATAFYAGYTSDAEL